MRFGDTYNKRSRLTRIDHSLSHFRPVRVEQCLGKHQRRSLARTGSFMIFQQGATNVLNLLSVVALSRLLTPDIFGLVAMVSFFQILMTTVCGSGFLQSVVQVDHLERGQLNNIFWLNAGIAILLGIGLAVSGPWISEFYSEPKLVVVSLVLGSVFALQNVLRTHHALLQRAMKTEITMFINVLPIAVGLITGVILAFCGATLWALLGVAIVSTLTRSALTIAFVRWLPGLPDREVRMQEMVQYGLRSTFGSIVYFFSTNIQILALGKLASPADVGYYNRGMTLYQRPMESVIKPLGNVLLPAMSSMQNEPQKLES